MNRRLHVARTVAELPQFTRPSLPSGSSFSWKKLCDCDWFPITSWQVGSGDVGKRVNSPCDASEMVSAVAKSSKPMKIQPIVTEECYKRSAWPSNKNRELLHSQDSRSACARWAST